MAALKLLSQGLMDLLGSQKGIVVLVVIVCATVMTMTGKMSVGEWTEYTKWIALGYIGVNGAQRITETLKGKVAPLPPAGG